MKTVSGIELAKRIRKFQEVSPKRSIIIFVTAYSEYVEDAFDVNAFHAIRLNVKRGKYGGMYAHKDIAFEFASAISPVFKIYLIREFQRLKEQENDQNKTEWNL